MSLKLQSSVDLVLLACSHSKLRPNIIGDTLNTRGPKAARVRIPLNLFIFLGYEPLQAQESGAALKGNSH
ncbi:MAG: hypothetical protein ACHQWH_03330 [Nitrososphaerales archaeon]